MSAPFGQAPPHNKDAEASVLGGVLLRRDAIVQLFDLPLEAGDFYVPAHQDIFGAMLALFERNEPIDPITLDAELRKQDKLSRVGGIAYLGELQSRVPTAENVAHYGKLVRDASTVRQLITMSSELTAEGYSSNADVEEFLDDAQQKIFDISQRSMRSKYEHIRPVLHETFKAIQSRMGSDRPVTGVPTGFADIDRLTNGFQPNDLVIVAARPSVGKTSFAITAASNAACNHGLPTLLFSLEMSKESLAERLLCGKASVDSSRVRAGVHLGQEDWRRLTSAASDLSGVPIYIDDSPAPTALEIRAKARRFRSDKKLFPKPDSLGMVIIDYLQLVKPASGNQNREQEVATVSRNLKALAKELRMPVIALSQLKRGVEERENAEPRLSDLRESGALEQDADVVSFLHRPRTDDRSAIRFTISKQRNGPIGGVDLVFLGQYTRFESASRQNEEQPF